MPPYRRHVALVYNVTGATLEFYPPPDEIAAFGAPTSAATYSVWAGVQGLDETAQFSGTSTLDTVSTTTDAAVGPSQARRNRVPLTATTSTAVGRRYLITNLAASGGQRQIVTVKSIQAADSVDHEQDVQTEFASGSAFVGLRHSFTVDATFIATQTNINVYGSLSSQSQSWDAEDTRTSAPPYRIRWTYTLGGETRHHWTTFDVCRAPLKHSVTIDHVKVTWPDSVWLEWTQQRGSDFQPQIDEAFDRLKFDIRMAGYDPDMITDPEIVDRLVKLGAVACITHALDRDPEGKYEAAYQNSFQKAIGTGLKAWISTSSTGAIAPDAAVQLWLTR